MADYQTVRLSLKGHPMGLLRQHFRQDRVVTCAEANALADGRRARVAGVVLVRQRPGSGNAIFITLEDESGVVNGPVVSKANDGASSGWVGKRRGLR